ncbi:type II toxin-antitoxin system VapC family toxin [Amycolatopsis rhabdoformis]|uniref:Ribonuclease VapC n=1 Tax=Amycolatopsis rhabdoformis TaxID=1448059 RepID=A0ABZ1I523_9PSEU|nr:type II toxin-antitoxin system VapC family toxin [Amycolatopsis rhabdoformis]WSE28953.1 type II toxin-antitoxin system VapC family toxin [Amycolatopsis rhabdoformis]
MTEPAAEIAVLDASVLVDLLAGTSYADAAKSRLKGTVLHAPAHLDAEVLSALGRLQRAGELTTAEVETGLGALTTLPLTRHSVADLAAGAWARRADLRLTDALYVELAAQLKTTVLTTDRRLARASSLAEEVG